MRPTNRTWGWIGRFTFTCMGLLFLAHSAEAQSATSSVDGLQTVAQSLVVSETSADHRAWNTVVILQDDKGNTVVRTNRAYVELETGMNFNENGKWKEAQEVIEAYPGGAIARQGGHKVIFADNLNSAVVIDLQTRDDKRLQSRVLGLSYLDTASGKSVMFAEVKDCTGRITASNVVLYADAFTGVSADVRYTWTKAGFEQDVILVTRPPTPESFGLVSTSTRLQVLTEFILPPVPEIQTTKFAAEAGGFEDQTLDFGVMQMLQGKAFTVGLDQAGAEETPVAKRWSVVDGRTILFEEVAVTRIADQLETLPVKKRIAFLWKKSARQMAWMKLNLPAPKPAKAAKREMQMAKLNVPARGVVLDYQLLSTSSSVTLKGDTTYYVTGLVNLSGTTTI